MGNSYTTAYGITMPPELVDHIVSILCREDSPTHYSRWRATCKYAYMRAPHYLYLVRGTHVLVGEHMLSSTVLYMTVPGQLYGTPRHRVDDPTSPKVEYITLRNKDTFVRDIVRSMGNSMRYTIYEIAPLPDTVGATFDTLLDIYAVYSRPEGARMCTLRADKGLNIMLGKHIALSIQDGPSRANIIAARRPDICDAIVLALINNGVHLWDALASRAVIDTHFSWLPFALYLV